MSLTDSAVKAIHSTTAITQDDPRELVLLVAPQIYEVLFDETIARIGLISSKDLVISGVSVYANDNVEPGQMIVMKRERWQAKSA